MKSSGWADCPQAVRVQVTGFVGALRETLGADLLGVYLHGSLAMGCFNAERSDVDLLVVTRHSLSRDPLRKRRIAELLLRRSAAPAPIEISFLTQQDLEPWEYPTLFDLHYSEDWRQKLEAELASEWDGTQRRDPDLAAHITVTLKRGLCLYGKTIAEMFPAVPAIHYVDSIVTDFGWGRERLAENPVYFILNACRVLAYLREGQVCSKGEGGAWGADSLPEQFRGLVTQAREVYCGQFGEAHLDKTLLTGFADYMDRAIRAAQEGGRTE